MTETVWTPNAKQHKALALRSVRELFYGGARGGGKTDFLIVDFLNGLNEWGEHWNGIFFRKTYSQLEEPVKRAKQIYLPLGAEYHKAENFFSFPNGASIKFRYLESDTDCEDYQGHSYTWIGFDELGNYRSDYAWTTMMMCNRSAHVPEEWLRIRGTGNPGGVGHKWLKARFIDGREPVKVYPEKVGEREDGSPMLVTRAFVPATVNDNTVLMKMNPRYKAMLMAQPERVRLAMLEGRWDIKGGGEFFDEFDETLHIIPPTILSGEWRRYYAMDWGSRSPWAVVKIAVGKDGQVVIYGEMYGQGVVDGVEKENVGDRATAEDVALRCAEAMAAEGVTEMVADYSCWSNDTGLYSVADFFINAGIDMIKCVKHTKNGRRSWDLVHELLREKDHNGAPYLRIFSTCKYLIREIETIQCDKTKMEDCDSRQSDHALDALRYGLYSELYQYGGSRAEPVRSEAVKKTFAYNPLEHGYWKPPRSTYG
jgi:hypothetical protein